MSSVSNKVRKAIHTELKTEYLFIAIPFLLLIGVKLYIGTWQEIVLSPEWSLASCIIFGQIIAKVSMGVSRTELKTNEQSFGWYTAKRVLMVIIAIAFYFGMLAKPTMLLGGLQIALFLVASRLHFVDGNVIKLLQLTRQ